MIQGDAKQCSRCGADFTCGARADSCWCQNLPALPASAMDIQVDCRCPRCLEEIIALASRSASEPQT